MTSRFQSNVLFQWKNMHNMTNEWIAALCIHQWGVPIDWINTMQQEFAAKMRGFKPSWTCLPCQHQQVPHLPQSTQSSWNDSACAPGRFQRSVRSRIWLWSGALPHGRTPWGCSAPARSACSGRGALPWSCSSMSPGDIVINKMFSWIERYIWITW